MERFKLWFYGHSNATPYTMKVLSETGYNVTNSYDNTCTHLVLPVPSFDSEGSVRGGENIESILSILNPNITIIGGNLNHPALSTYTKMDLLNDPQYIAENAAITAYCALKIAMLSIDSIIIQKRILIMGWGRIGKCLAKMLKDLGCNITVAARKDADRAILSALGYKTIDIININANEYDIIFNTIPSLILKDCNTQATIIELASQPGVTGAHLINARGLPGKEAPESSGKLIAQTIHKLLLKKEANL